MRSPSLPDRIRRGLVAATATVLALAVVPAQSSAAVAAPAPAAVVAAADPPPATVTADALPTWQINGVVWSQAIIGDVVYVAGSFSRARPPGVSPGGAGEVVANNIFAYRLSTGARVSAFGPSLNAQALVIRASLDNSRLYVGGDFTTVNGVSRGHVAALDPANGSVIGSFAPNVGGQVRGLGITASTIYVGGNFPSANGVTRTRLAAFQTSNGAMTNWAPAAAGGYVWSMTMSPDRTRVIPAGSFTTLAGQPAYGMGSISTDGSINPWPAQEKIRAAGANGAITSIKSDATQVYGTSYAFGAGATYEGTFAVDPNTGQINWQNDCLGDTYDIAAAGPVLYNVSHQHDCSVVDGWPDTNPRSRWQKAGASYSYATGTQTKNDAYGWAGSYGLLGTPNAALLHWYPNFAFGSYTSARQAGWAIDTSSDGEWVVVGGEFPRVNGQNQQGITRFRTKAGAPNKEGPSYSTVPSTPIPETSAVSLSAGEIRVSFGSAWDYDDEELTYEVLRNNSQWVASIPSKSNFWTLPRIGFVDKDVSPGTGYRYQVRVKDAAGNVQWGPTSDTVTVGSGAPSAYADAVRADGAEHLWRLGEPSGSTAYDWAGFDDASLAGGYTRGASGALAPAETNAATSFNGSNGVAVSGTQVQGPDVFTVETWFRTTSTSGGKIVGFGNRNTGTSNNYDRHIYMSPNGRVSFGVYNGGTYTVTTSTALNDGQWHQAVGTMGPGGLTLYVDGLRIGSNGGTSVGQPYSGYWRIGGDSSWDGNPYFAGDIDEVAIYPTELSRTKVQDHYRASGRTLDVPTRPTDSYGRAVWDADPEVYFRLNETGGAVAKDSSPNGVDGVYSGSGFTYGASTPVTGSTSAVGFNGQFGTSVGTGTDMGAAPGAFSQELWFKTTTTSGGKLIGKGCAQSGNSGCYDRHIWMENSGQLSFGTWTGQTNIATSPGSYNDGQWHYVVSSQGPDGMKLYVDGALAATNPQTQAENSAGFWRIGGDRTWSGSSDWFAGTIDEVAVYRSVLNQATISDHFAKGGGDVPNQNPTASFTTTKSFLTVSTDADASSDPDGTIASYAWDFGDGGTATGKTAEHTYTSAGAKTITLTVTDDRNGTATTTRSVTVAANQAPTAALTTTVDGLDVAVDGSGSTDPDGTIESWAWSFGDGGTGTGETTDHRYTTAGTYTVTLTVTDDAGATNSATRQVTVETPPDQRPTARFTSSVAGSVVSVNGSTSSDPEGPVASYAWDFGDGGSGSGATTTHPYAAPGTYTVTLVVTDGAGQTGTVSHDVTIAAPDPFLAADDFQRSVTDGWGSADTGGPWSLGGPAGRWSVASGTGRVQLNPGNGYTAALTSVSSTSTATSVTLGADKDATGGGQYISVIGRRVSSSDDYRAKLRVASNGAVAMWLTRMNGGSETTMTSTTVGGLTVGGGERLQVRLEVTGTSPTTVRAKVWKVGGTEPAGWTLTTTDSSSGLQTAGGVGLYYYLSGSTTNGPVVLATDDLRVSTP